ncbi:hypothetical protein [Anaerolentibacter hominis]|uniref:hypothetical protein n=1 Tax=Anaerolentibacter hominis TaxID=3079009 RepID=UPI0031B831AB
MTQIISYTDNGRSCTCQLTLPTLSVMNSFAETVAAHIMQNDYSPVLEDFFFDYKLLELLTDVSLPEDPDEAYAYLARTNLVAAVKEGIPDPSLIHSLKNNVQKKVSYLKQKAIHASAMDDLLISINDYIRDLTSKLSERTPDEIRQSLASAQAEKE